MQLLILATLVAVVAAGQIRVGDDSSDNVEVHVIKWEVRQIDQTEPPTKPPTKHHRKTRKRARNPPKRRAKTASDGWKSYLSSRYKVFRDAKDFDDAEKRCREERAHLVSIHSEQENQFVHRLAYSPPWRRHD
ncbi:hypothetical protein Y032_0005g2380 [Ancylostoma ceylanicum]|uniref:C-type lectin domain-containing protein n=1 Tax=Ancylostoma ceylanicum TaxID=53326 RepID=A0A016VTB5_9BILA|nr:hypothetical protein Y032_0005g2380 [Ancylostoma ceylanicum]